MNCSTLIRSIRNPVIIAGDMNTFGQDDSNISLKAAAVKKAERSCVLGHAGNQVRNRSGTRHGRCQLRF